MIKLITFLILFIPTIGFSLTLDLECKIKPYGETYTKFIYESKEDHSTTANDIKRDSDIIYLSIDTEKEEIIFPKLYDTKITISPTNFMITSFVPCEDKNNISCKNKIYHYKIDRISGMIEGSKYAGDNSWMPYFNSGELMWYFHGSCDKLDRKF